MKSLLKNTNPAFEYRTAQSFIFHPPYDSILDMSSIKAHNGVLGFIRGHIIPENLNLLTIDRWQANMVVSNLKFVLSSSGLGTALEPAKNHRVKSISFFTNHKEVLCYSWKSPKPLSEILEKGFEYSRKELETIKLLDKHRYNIWTALKSAFKIPKEQAKQHADRFVDYLLDKYGVEGLESLDQIGVVKEAVQWYWKNTN